MLPWDFSDLVAQCLSCCLSFTASWKIGIFRTCRSRYLKKILYIQYRTIVQEKSFEIVIDANSNPQDWFTFHGAFWSHFSMKKFHLQSRYGILAFVDKCCEGTFVIELINCWFVPSFRCCVQDPSNSGGTRKLKDSPCRNSYPPSTSLGANSLAS